MSSGPRFPRFDTIAIVGVGLIGGSIAAALKLRGIAKIVVGVGRNRERLERAQEAGIIDRVATDFDEVGSAQLVVVCTPVDRIVKDVQRAAELGPGTLISDAGSVKTCLRDELRGTLPGGVTYVGSHPLAGSEKTGWENGKADLFVNRVCVITPDDDSPDEAVATIEGFWQTIGMRTQRMTAEEHDRAVAATSHVPHVTAAAVMALIDETNQPLASTGFRDVTRIAAGDPALWVAILRGNKPAVIAQIDQLLEQLVAYRRALSADEYDAIEQLLAQAKSCRDTLEL